MTTDQALFTLSERVGQNYVGGAAARDGGVLHGRMGGEGVH